MRSRTAAGWRVTSNPATRAVPESGRSSVARMRIRLVFPAPLGPALVWLGVAVTLTGLAFAGIASPQGSAPRPTPSHPRRPRPGAGCVCFAADTYPA